ncbi:hypothetical protein [Pleionea sp. CnH1-48]|uniref:hypothetical protein n=1 Tax=Pleionea sp. CnH1-48 TaxID=2954494 RepID=UPI002096A7F8|nr:hypothetical protein [Pleionea sp. CnH1-48]MCO7225795.1 hypothetical protein [Pleionea sp. CnH1-48]
MKRIFIAALLSISSVVLSTAVLSLTLMLIGGDFSGAALGVSVVFIYVATIIGGLGIFFVAIPLHLFLQYKNIDSVKPYVVTGLIASMGFGFIFKPFGNDDFLTLIQQLLIVGTVGAVCALVFWYVAVKGEANKVSC